MTASSSKRSVPGCWTCRLRRKKCDNVQPQCGICESLEISCHYSTSQKPEWMVDAGKRREMLDTLKRHIKENTTARRERRQILSGAVRNNHFVIESGSCTSRSSAPSVESGLDSSNDYRLSGDTKGWGYPDRQVPELPPAYLLNTTRASSKDPPPCETAGQAGSILEFCDHSKNERLCTSSFDCDSEFETDMIMKYLDYVFPFLFPFYRPAIFETGRSWLLSLLKHCDIAFHSALSLTSYFFTVALGDAYGSTYTDCSELIWIRLEQQINKCFELVQSNMMDLTLRGKTAAARRKVHVMESIIQMLIFEVVIGRAADWNLHLTPILALFEEVLDAPMIDDSKLISVLHSIGVPTWYKVEYNNYIWSPDQAGFRFFATLLIFIDIIGSTALQQQPKLSVHYSDLLEAHDDGAPILGFTQLRLSTAVGCQNSVLIDIGRVSSLDAWKQSMKRARTVSISELLERASPIKMSLQLILEELRSRPGQERVPDHPSLPFQAYAVRFNASSTSTITTRIWAHAAQIYLIVVVSGWQPYNTEIQSHVSSILESLKLVATNHFRTLAWPICVAGCLVSTGREQDFRDLFSKKTDLEMIGSLSEARRVMERVWEKRSSLDPETWDLASCLNVLGKPVLLI